MKKIAIVGDVDSGKSTLIGRLINNRNEDYYKSCDTFKNELLEHKTITSSYYIINNYMFINVPGHIEYINDIIYSISISDFAIILIGYKNGYTQNTQKYIELCKFFNIPYQILINISDTSFDFECLNFDIINLYETDLKDLEKIIFNFNRYNKHYSKYNMILLTNDLERIYLDEMYHSINLNYSIKYKKDIFYNIQTDCNLNTNVGIYNKKMELVGYICKKNLDMEE